MVPGVRLADGVKVAVESTEPTVPVIAVVPCINVKLEVVIG